MDPATIAAVGWSIKILGWVISPIMSKLVSKGWSYLQDVAGSSANNLQNLEEKVEHLKLMLGAARVSPDDEKKLERWVKKLKSAFYDAEDILDAIEYHRLKCKAVFHRQSVNTTKKKATTKKDFNFPPGSKEELRKTLKRIEDLIDEGQKLLSLLRLTTSGGNIKSSPEQTTGSGSRLRSLSKTTSEPPKVFGRDEDTKKIRSMLHDTTDDHVAIVIHGFAGTGKTTLAQYVCESEKKNFELFMWIHVTKNFSVHTVYKEMSEIASGQEMGSLSNLDMLQRELKRKLKGKRLLLVLDDVWYSESVAEQDDVKKLLSPLKAADKGSRVLVTSRTADAAKLLDVAHHLTQISDMNEKDFFKMFMHYALNNSMVSDQATRSTFETIGKKIAALLRRSPLAARTVAGQLRIRTSRAEDIGFWIDTLRLKSDLLNDTMGALWWSYHQLEEHVRQCFAYCSMFPRRYELKQDELVHMWTAQGFMDTSKTSDMEVAARDCFQVLLSTSFIQLKFKILDIEYYTVHDLLHDLAERVAGSDCFRIEKDTVDHQIPQDVRHLFIASDNLGELMGHIVEQRTTLRTLIMPISDIKITAEDFERMLKELKKLRYVHVFVEVKQEELKKNVIPDCIRELKHLRYLALFGEGGLIKLPLAFTQLYHLQGFEVSLGASVFCPHNEMADLVNLRHIGGFRSSIPDIGRMLLLQTLGAFTVKKEKGYEITQLEKLNNIHGELTIHGLGNIQSKEDARRANLSNKLHVTSLVFDWETYETESSPKKRNTDDHHQQEVTPAKPEEILEALHPPSLLVELWIENYGGSTIPSWLSAADGNLNHLESLSFYNCHGPGSHFQFREPFLPRLHKVEINTCSWDALPDNICQLASLEELRIDDCTNIKSLPRLPSSLKRLSIYDCTNIKSLPEFPPSLEMLTCDKKSLVDSYPDKQAIKRIDVFIYPTFG